MDGFEALGELIGGAGASGTGSEAYLQGLTGGHKARSAMYDADKSREEARIMRARAIAREALPDAIGGVYTDPRMAALASAVLGSNATADIDQLGDLAVPTALPAYEAAAAAAATGDTAAQNRATALAGGDQYEPFDLDAGGKAVFRPDTGEVAMTALGDLVMDSEAAQAQQRLASAGASSARADATRDRTANPERYRAPPKAGGSGKADDPSSEANMLRQAREAIGAGAKRSDVAKRLRDLGYSNVAEKL